MIAVRTRTGVWLSLPVFGALFALLFQYRILSLMGKLGIKVSPFGTKFPIQLDFLAASQWMLPFYYTVDYVNAIWFTTALGLLIGGALFAVAPAFIRSNLGGKQARQVVSGILLGLPNMFCTCCAVSTATALRKAGAGLLGSLTFFVSAPALNIVVILLAFQFLPLKLAIARTLLGLVAAAGITYLVARLNPGLWEAAARTGQAPRLPESTLSFIKSWMGSTWNLTKSVVPLLFVGLLAIGVFKTLVQFDAIARYFGEGIWTTFAAALIGTVLMVPTFTEVLWVQEFTKQGMGNGPAVAILVTLPSVSFPSLWVLGKVFGSYRLAALLGIGIQMLGFVGGLIFAII